MRALALVVAHVGAAELAFQPLLADTPLQVAARLS
jgi:hypothetical protein